MITLCVLFCGCACLSFSDTFAYGYVVMMLHVIRSDITIKKLTWYQSHPERSICATKTVLQLQLLKIRVSCLKTLKYKTSNFGTFAIYQDWGRIRSRNFYKAKINT